MLEKACSKRGRLLRLRYLEAPAQATCYTKYLVGGDVAGWSDGGETQLSCCWVPRRHCAFHQGMSDLRGRPRPLRATCNSGTRVLERTNILPTHNAINPVSACQSTSPCFGPLPRSGGSINAVQMPKNTPKPDMPVR